MRIQKCYIGYCIAMWILWFLTFIVMGLVGNDGYSIASSFSYVSVWVMLIPVHWVLGICSLVFSVKNQRKKHTFFNAFSMCVNFLGGIFMLVLYIGHVG